MNKTRVIVGGLVALFVFPVIGGEKPREAFCAESDSVRWTIGTDARTLGFVDKRSGINYAALQKNVPVASVQRGGRTLPASRATAGAGHLRLGFADSDVTVDLKLTGAGAGLSVEVLSVKGENVEACTFVQVPLALKGTGVEPFAACALALNLQTQVRRLPQATDFLEASCYRRFGFAGAKVALIGCPPANLRGALQEAVRAAPELPHSPIGGPWALDADINRGSYLFAPVSEKTVDDWIRLAQNLGFTQIDFDGMSRYGDAEPFPALYPNGRAGLKAAVAKVHAAGLKAGVHSYSFFIDKRCPWVTPVPDKRLGSDAVFTLSEPLDAKASTVVVSAPVTNVSAVTGFFVRNSATLRVDDELIVYAETGGEGPCTFTKCQRGACGTHAAPHAAGAKACHLKECFGRFAPDPDSTLLAEVAARQAQTVNDCGFDMMYLDALDGEDILGGGENGWHYGSRFVFELWKRFDHPVLLEMSTMHHHLWTVRSRMGAWDHPTRSHKPFIDLHCAANARDAKMFLPLQLGWWAVKTWSGPQGEPTFSDDIEYLCGKAIGNGVGLSLMGVTPETYAKSAALQRLGGIFRAYETLRHAQAFPESVKARLRVPGDEFTLDSGADGKARLRPARYDKHTVEARDEGRSAAWTVTNAFARQPLRLRLEVLMSAVGYDSSNAVALAGPTEQKTVFAERFAPGVSASFEPANESFQAGVTCRKLSAANASAGRRGSWACFGQTFAPPLKFDGERALGVWVNGDGRGEVLNLQLACPRQVVSGFGEHYIPVDFTGWRYFELIESEGARYADYAWPYGNIYSIYRERVDCRQIERLSVWINNLPAKGSAACVLGPVRAFPLLKATIRNPRLAVGGRALTFPVEMESGCYLESNAEGTCQAFGPGGERIKDVGVSGGVPELNAGENQLRFSCDAMPGALPRVRVTVMTTGALLK